MNKELLLSLLKENKLKELHEVLSKGNPVDIAEIISEMDETNMGIVFRLLEKRSGAEVFSYMENDARNKLIKSFSRSKIVEIIDEMYADDAVDFLAEMPANVITSLLDNTDKEQRRDINHLLQYKDDSVGSIMTVEFVELNKDMSVKEALDKIKRVGIDSETIYTCYVVERKKCIGIVTAKDLILNDLDEKISNLMKSEFIYALTSDDREDVAVEVQTSVKLAPEMGLKTQLFINKDFRSGVTTLTEHAKGAIKGQLTLDECGMCMDPEKDSAPTAEELGCDPETGEVLEEKSEPPKESTKVISMRDAVNS